MEQTVPINRVNYSTGREMLEEFIKRAQEEEQAVGAEMGSTADYMALDLPESYKKRLAALAAAAALVDEKKDVVIVKK